MPKYVPWDQQPRGNKGSGSTQFLKLEAGKKYKVRLVSKPLVYFQHWDPIACRSPQPAEDGKVLDPLMLMGFEPKRRYSIWVLDREEGNKLKIMDFPPTLYEQFVEWKNNFNDDPGGPNGPDWIIKLELPGGDKRRTKYKASYLDKRPFTKEEAEAIANGNLNEKLADVRRDHSPDEIRQMLADQGKEGAVPQKQAPQGNAPQGSFAPRSTTAPVQAKRQPVAETETEGEAEAEGEASGDGLDF